MRFSFCALLLCLVLSGNPVPTNAAPLRVGIEINNEPLSFVQADGRPAGFVAELVEAVAQEMNFSVTPITGKWDDLFDRFKAGEIDAMACLAYSAERDKFIDFSTSHLRLNGALFVRKGSPPIRNFEELRPQPRPMPLPPLQPQPPLTMEPRSRPSHSPPSAASTTLPRSTCASPASSMPSTSRKRRSC